MVAATLRRVRATRNVSVRELAVLAGVSRAAIEGIEAGRRVPRARTMRAIAGALGVKESSISEFAAAIEKAAEAGAAERDK